MAEYSRQLEKRPGGGPEEAARMARDIQRDPESTATIFSVTAKGERLSKLVVEGDLPGRRL